MAEPVELFDDLVNRLFRTGLVVNGCLPLVDETVAIKLGSAVEMLDSMVRDVRRAVLEAQGAATPVVVGVANDSPPGPLDLRVVTHILEDAVEPILTQVSRTVEELWLLARSSDQVEAAVALSEASQSLYRALIALDGARPDQ